MINLMDVGESKTLPKKMGCKNLRLQEIQTELINENTWK